MLVHRKDCAAASRRLRNVFVLFSCAALLAGAARIGIAQQGSTGSADSHSTGDEPAVGDAAEYEVLRRLLGVPAPEKPSPPEAPPAPAVEAEPARPLPAKPAPVAKKPQAPAKKAVARPAPKPAAKDPEPAVAEQVPAATEPAAPVASPAKASAPGDLSSDDLPPAGAVLRAGDIERWKHLFGPSAQWAMLRGAKVRVGERKSIPMEEARQVATQRYHSQVQLTADRRDMKNYVAGIPFPLVTEDDPDAGAKIMFNQQARIIVDDVDARQMGCDIGTIDPERGFQRERTFQIEHWRRLFYVSRLYHEPLPTWENQAGIRYRELQYPLIEPFDLKGGGWNFIRYLDVGRPDDGWLYYPVMRRVRRISTAQRSQGIFGQDMDLDSYTGYAGNPAWMEWRLVGTKTILAAMHSAHVPVKWQAPPADFAADEPWEPREVHVIEGRSLLAEYGFARRVVYVDKESYLIAQSEIYDHQGKLWKALHQTWGFGSKVRADAGGRTFEEFYLPGYVMIDMQIDHITRCELPSSAAVGDKGWYYNYGEAEGTVEAAFDFAGFLGETH